MMRAGKDYMTAVPEYEDKRFLHLQELVATIKAQGSTDTAAPPKPEDEKPPQTNQDKPTLKLK